MATPQARSCNDNLKMGMTDGGWKKYDRNRGGIVEATSVGFQKAAAGVWHGFHELREKCLPDGRMFVDPGYQDITPQDPENV